MPVSKLDTINVLDPEFIPETVQDVLEIKRAELIEELRQSLADADRVSTGALQQSIDVNYSPSEKGFLFTLIMDDYWKFVDKGVNGTIKNRGSEFSYKRGGGKIPIKAMTDFVRARGIQWQKTATHYKNKKGIFKKRKNKLSSVEAAKQIGYAIGYRLKENGLKPTHFYTNVVDEAYEQRFIEDTVTKIVELGNNG